MVLLVPLLRLLLRLLLLLAAPFVVDHKLPQVAGRAHFPEPGKAGLHRLNACAEGGVATGAPARPAHHRVLDEVVDGREQGADQPGEREAGEWEGGLGNNWGKRIDYGIKIKIDG